MPELGIGIDGRRAAVGSRIVVRSLNDIRAAAHTTSGSVKRLDASMQKTAVASRVLQRALTGVGAAFLTREFVRLSDSAINIENRLKIATETTGELVAVQEELFAISQRTRSSFDANATLFNRLALSTKELGVSLQEVLQLTESLNQAVILSGAATTEASAGLIQLSQGLASNRLSGDELRSVLEQLPVIANVIASELGVTRGELKFLGEQGLISAETVVRAFRNAREELATRFGRTVPTISQSFLLLRNAAIRFTASFNKSTGVATGLSRIIIALANNFDTLIKATFSLAIALGPIVLGKALALAVSGFRTLAFAIRANPFGALVIAITAAVGAIINFGDQINIFETFGDTAEDGILKTIGSLTGLGDKFGETGNRAITLQDLLFATFDAIGDTVSSWASFVSDQFLAAFANLSAAVNIGTLSFDDLVTAARSLANTVIGVFVGLYRAIKSIMTNLRELLGRALDTVSPYFVDFGRGVLKVFGTVFNKIKQGVVSVVEFVRDALPSDVLKDSGITFTDLPVVREFTDIGKDASDAFLSAFGTDYVGQIGGILTKPLDDIIDRAGERARKRLEEAAAKAAEAQGTDLGATRGTGEPIATPQIKKFLAKAIKDTRTPLEELRFTLAEIEKARPFAKTEEGLTALKRAAEEAFATFAKATGGEESPFVKLQRDIALLEQQKGLASTAAEVEVLNRAIMSTKEALADEALGSLGLPDTKQLLTETLTPLEQYNQALQRLQFWLDQGIISQDLFDAAVKRAKEDILGLGDVFEEFAKQAARNLQSAFADFLFDPFEDGLDGMLFKFAETLKRMAAEALANQILQAFFNSMAGAGGGFGAFFGTLASSLGGAQFGGAVSAGVPIRVGEGGREEVFVPSTNGRVMTSKQANDAMANPNVNVSNPVNITNVVDPGSMVAAVESAQGQKAIMNVIRANPDAIRRALS